MSQVCYQIASWNESFENERSRDIAHCSHVWLPNKQSGLGYSRIIQEPDGAAIYGIWAMLVATCSQHEGPRNGWLTDNGAAPVGVVSGACRGFVGGSSGVRRGRMAAKARRAGLPWEPDDLACKLRRPLPEIQRCLDLCSNPRVGWLIRHELTQVVETSQLADVSGACRGFVGGSLGVCAEVVASKAEAVPTEQNRTEQNLVPPTRPPVGGCPTDSKSDAAVQPTEPEQELPLETSDGQAKEEGGKPELFSRKRTLKMAEEILAHLNKAAGREYHPIETHLKPIACRLEEVSLDTHGVEKMIDRQCALWKGDEKMDTYLRVSTLFNKTKFHEYYTVREMPTKPRRAEADHSKPF